MADQPKKAAQQHILHSWKEIADYTRKGVRTLQRYEKEFGFPIRRPSGSQRSAVMAFPQEIDDWFARAQSGVTHFDREPDTQSAMVVGPVVTDKIKLTIELSRETRARTKETRTLLAELKTRTRSMREARAWLRAQMTARKQSTVNLASSDHFGQRFI